MLLVCFITYIIYDIHSYQIIYSYLSQTIGCSIFTNIYFLYFIYRNNMCAYTKVATYGLLALNLLDISALIFGESNFHQRYLIITSATFIVLTIIFYVRWKMGLSK